MLQDNAMCDGCQYPLDGKGHSAGCKRDAIDRLQLQVAQLRRDLFDAMKQRDGWEQDCAHWRERAEAAEATQSEGVSK